MNRFASAAVAAVFGVATIAASASGASAEWKGPRGGNWNQGGNWNKGGGDWNKGGKHWGKGHGYKPHTTYNYYGGWGGSGAGFAAGAILGLTFGALATAPRYPAYYYPPAPRPYAYRAGVEAHIEWCIATYRSYNPATNLYRGYDGHLHECRGPG